MADKKIKLPNISGFESSEDVAKFKTFRKKVQQVYGGDESLGNRYSHKTTSRTIFNLREREDLQLLLEQAFNNPLALANVSRQLHNLDPNYQKIISYYADMFFVRYTVLPVLLDRMVEVDNEIYLEEYYRMIEVTDGLTLESTVPEILGEVFLSGAAYLTAKKDNSSKTISIIILPYEYCRTVLKTAYGTNLIEFNFQYFDLFKNKEDLERVFGFFPDEFRTGWERYKNGETMGPGKDIGWLELDPRFSTSVLANEKGLPPLINSMEGIFEYDRVRDAETQKTENQLKKIFVHRIPTTSSGELIFDLDEVREIHSAISRIVKKHEGLDIITAFGETELMSLQEETSVENKAITQAYQSVFNSAGINSELFMGKTADSLKANLKIDKAHVWKFVTLINNYVNVIINQLFNFKPFQAEVSILPITQADEMEQIKLFRENAAFGIGKLEAIVSVGIKQKHLTDRAKLEDVLQLDTLLKPLQSSHTQSGTQTAGQQSGAAETPANAGTQAEDQATNDETAQQLENGGGEANG